jgi:radical SAM-linked protein
MSLVSHLDLLRLFDRVVRRSQIPIAFTGGFHPGPRIAPANALALGATSHGEIVDFELTQEMEVEQFRQMLAACLPADIPIYRVDAIELSAPSATQAVHQAEYLLTVATPESVELHQWQAWIDQVKAATEINFEHTTKSGKKRAVNLCDRLLELDLSQVEPTILRYIGTCCNDGDILRPEHLMLMLEQISGQTFELQHIHRQQLILKT